MAEPVLPERAEAAEPRGEGQAPPPAAGSAGPQERAEEDKPGRGSLCRAAAPRGRRARGHLRPGAPRFCRRPLPRPPGRGGAEGPARGRPASERERGAAGRPLVPSAPRWGSADGDAQFARGGSAAAEAALEAAGRRAVRSEQAAPAGARIPPRTEIVRPLWTTCAAAWPPLRGKCFLYPARPRAGAGTGAACGAPRFVRLLVRAVGTGLEMVPCEGM